jgi:hypothetical protein
MDKNAAGSKKARKIKDDDFYLTDGESCRSASVVLSNWAYINWWKRKPTLLAKNKTGFAKMWQRWKIWNEVNNTGSHA